MMKSNQCAVYSSAMKVCKLSETAIVLDSITIKTAGKRIPLNPDEKLYEYKPP